MSLDYTEIDLWWLLVNKARREKVGFTFYYEIECGNEINRRRLAMLESFGVIISIVNADDYYEGYRKVLEMIKGNIQSFDVRLSEKSKPGNEPFSTSNLILEKEPPPKQLKLPVKRSRRKKATK